MATPSKKVLDAAAVAMMDVTTDIAVPNRARSFSFASQLATLAAGEAPAAKVVPFYPNYNSDFLEQLQTAKGNLRNNVASSISAAKRRVDGNYRVETGTLTMDSGMYVVALVHRIE